MNIIRSIKDFLTNLFSGKLPTRRRTRLVRRRKEKKPTQAEWKRVASIRITDVLLKCPEIRHAWIRGYLHEN